MRKLTLTALALLTLLPVALQAQTAEERIEAAMARAQQAGIPLSLLETKIGEGTAKGVAMEKIAVAVEKRANALLQAKSVMGRGGKELSDADLASGADALGAGISEAILQTISETAPQERRAVAITALTALVAAEVVPAEALQKVMEALARGPEALASLPGAAAVARGAQAGPPAGVPTPGQKPAAGKPANVGKPSSTPR